VSGRDKALKRYAAFTARIPSDPKQYQPLFPLSISIGTDKTNTIAGDPTSQDTRGIVAAITRASSQQNSLIADGGNRGTGNLRFWLSLSREPIAQGASDGGCLRKLTFETATTAPQMMARFLGNKN